MYACSNKKIVLKNHLHLRQFLVISKFFKLIHFKPPPN